VTPTPHPHFHIPLAGRNNLASSRVPANLRYNNNEQYEPQAVAVTLVSLTAVVLLVYSLFFADSLVVLRLPV